MPRPIGKVTECKHIDKRPKGWGMCRSCYQAKSRNEKAEWIRSLKDGKPCTDCGKFFPPYILDFDHTGTNGEKEFTIANSVRNNLSRERILKEVAKCDIVCKNCHARRTYERSVSSIG